MILSTGTVPGAGLRIIRSLAAELPSPSAYQASQPGRMALARLVKQAQVPDDEALLPLLWRLEKAGWIVQEQVNMNAGGRPNVVRLTDEALTLARRLGWAVA